MNSMQGVGFYGLSSEYIISGSDDANIFIWDKETEKLVRVLSGHQSIVNCVVQSPFEALLATSGIDDEVRKNPFS